jgi:polysaccharide deacetylase 2 family uncharacterized protein YibQ
LSAKEIERPLGQNRPPARTGRRRLSPAKGSVASVLIVLAVVGLSAAVALRGKPFRQPAIEITASEPPAASTPSATAPAEKAATDGKPDGPSIIHVNPPKGEAGGVVVVGDPAAAGQNLRIAHLPDRALIENSPSGPLPKRAADGRRPVDVYARPWSGARGARVAIVIGGLAVSQTGTQEAIAKLPPEVTLAFASSGNSIDRWMQAARQSGHEILMQLPLEPFDYPNVNPGRSTLTVDASPEENTANLHWVLGRTTNYTGVMNYMGARFVADATAMKPLMEELGQRGLLYLDDGVSARSTAQDAAGKSGVPFAAGDTIIDDVQERGAILKKLDQLEATARAKGFALGTGSAFNMTVDAVVTWVNEARKRGIEIVPVSAVANDPEKG